MTLGTSRKNHSLTRYTPSPLMNNNRPARNSAEYGSPLGTFGRMADYTQTNDPQQNTYYIASYPRNVFSFNDHFQELSESLLKSLHEIAVNSSQTEPTTAQVTLLGIHPSKTDSHSLSLHLGTLPVFTFKEASSQTNPPQPSKVSIPTYSHSPQHPTGKADLTQYAKQGASPDDLTGLTTTRGLGQVLPTTTPTVSQALASTPERTAIPLRSPTKYIGIATDRPTAEALLPKALPKEPSAFLTNTEFSNILRRYETETSRHRVPSHQRGLVVIDPSKIPEDQSVVVMVAQGKGNPLFPQKIVEVFDEALRQKVEAYTPPSV